MRGLIASVLLAAPVSASRAADKPDPLVGFWFGTLKVGLTELRLAFAVTQTDGVLGATLDSLDQGAKNLPFSDVQNKGGQVRIATTAAVGITFTGKLSADGKTLTGEWAQGKQALPLTMARVEKMPTNNRPQTPKPPYPYAAEEVTFDNAAAKVTLAGTLTLPKGDGPFPAVVLVTGSGP